MRLNTFLWGGDCLSLLWKDFFRALPWFRFSMKWLLNKKSWNISEESHFWQLYWIMHKNPGILQHCLIFTSYCVKANTWCASYDVETSYPQKDRQNIERWSSFLKRWPECLFENVFFIFTFSYQWQVDKFVQKQSRKELLKMGSDKLLAVQLGKEWKQSQERHF